jgi:hypothetical protein
MAGWTTRSGGFGVAGELADEGGAVAAEALALLSAAVAAGYGPALVRLAEFLLHQYSTADAASHAEALRLLREAVAAEVPGARHVLGVALWMTGCWTGPRICCGPRSRTGNSTCRRRRS